MAAARSYDRAAIVDDLLAGQFNEPVRVLAFNTLEHWSRDLSAEVAKQIQTRCDIEGGPTPEHLHDFVGRHAAAAEDVGDGRQMKMQKREAASRRLLLTPIVSRSLR
jgi:hypothetical protein